MKTRQLVAVFIETIIKVVVLILIIRFVYKYASNAYDFGYRVFAEKPISASEGRTITIAVSEDDTIDTIGNMLENKGLIRDSSLFKVQELLSAYHGEIKPGIYDLSTSMTVDEMLEVMSEEKEAAVIDNTITSDMEEDTADYEDAFSDDELPENNLYDDFGEGAENEG